LSYKGESGSTTTVNAFIAHPSSFGTIAQLQNKNSSFDAPLTFPANGATGNIIGTIPSQFLHNGVIYKVYRVGSTSQSVSLTNKPIYTIK
jgi:hypothetical protein